MNVLPPMLFIVQGNSQIFKGEIPNLSANILNKFSRHFLPNMDNMQITFMKVNFKTESFSKQVMIHFKFLAFSTNESRNMIVSSAYYKLTTPPGITCGRNQAIKL